MYIFALLLFCFLVSGHGDEFRVRSSGDELNIHFPEYLEEAPVLGKRQVCGAGVGSCPQGQCCSSGGQCGTGRSFCDPPDCQLAYGPACDGNTVPPGASTLKIPRPRVGNVPYSGGGVFHCVNQGQIALTFDDGPYIYTQQVLDTLAKYGAQATFFINGNNLGKGRIDDPSKPWVQVLKNMYTAGHHIASHTWTHQDLTLLPASLRENQVVYNEMAFRNIFGWFPAYIRPPYGFCAGSSGCADYLSSMGYHIIYYDVDTKDYMNDNPNLIYLSKNWFAGNVSATASGHSYMSLSHDVHQQTAISLVSYMLDTLKARGYKAVTVGECLGDPRSNWYRDAGGVPNTSPSASAIPVMGTTSSSRLAISTVTTHPILPATSTIDVTIDKTTVSTAHLASSTSSAAAPAATTSASYGLRVSVEALGIVSSSLVAMLLMWD